MPFQEKSAMAMAVILALVYGTYFAIIGRWIATTPAEEIAYQPLLIIATIPLALLASLSHIVLALVNPRAANLEDERDRIIAIRGEQVSGYVLAVGIFAGLVLAMAEQPHFYIAHALALGWVVAQIIEYMMVIVLYRRGA